MRETLYIRLAARADDEVEFGLSGIDGRLARSEKGSLERALDAASGRRLVLFVPAAEVRLTQATVPARQTSKVLQALPYLLEDQVAEDVDLLHFAIGPRQTDDSHPVAVVAHQRMEQWLSPIRARGLQVEALVPESLALPLEPEASCWHGLADGDEALVRAGAWSGFVCSLDDLPTYLLLADPQRAHRLRLRITGSNTSDWTRLDWPLELFPGVPSPLIALSATYRPETSINLLQGAYANGRDLGKLWRPWRLAAALAVAWILTAGLALGLDTWRLNAELKRQNEANVARFQQLFPTETRIVDLSAQLDQQLRALTGGGGARGVFPLLESLTQALAATPGLRLTGLQYRDGSLFLSLVAPDLQGLEQLRNWFASNPGAALEVQSANAEAGGAQIRARLAPA